MNLLKPIMVVLFLFGSAGMSYAAAASYLGHDGSFIVADNNTLDVVHSDGSGMVVRSTSGECIRTRWQSNSDECAARVASPPVKTMVNLTREERTIYFGFNLTSISPEMQQKLNTLASSLTSNSSVKGARIVGYADRIGNPKYNEKLSKKRAEVVKNYLISKGLINTQVADTRWLGSSTPVTDCPANLKRPDLINCLQADRRVEVEIDYATNVQATR